MSRRLVLLVEDDPDDEVLALRALKKSGLVEQEIAVARKGAEALDHLFGGPGGRGLEGVPDLVLLDEDLPDMEGTEVLRRLRADERTGSLPVMVLTAGDLPKVPDDHDAWAFLQKPLNPEKLAGVARKLGVRGLLSPAEGEMQQAHRTAVPGVSRAALRGVRPLRLLLVEDSEDDAALILRALRRAGYEPEWRRVETRAALYAALDEQGWEAVVCDYRLPGFGAVEALALVKESRLDLPFIVVSGKIGEDVAVEVMRAGADDCVMKASLSRLAPAVEREVREARGRRERRRAEAALRESERRFRTLVQNSSDITALLDARGTILYESPAVERVLGYAPEERVGRNIFDLIHPDDLGRVCGALARFLEESGVSPPVEYRIRHRDGSWRHFEAIGNDLRSDPAMRGIVVNSRDITERKAFEEELGQSEKLHRTVVEQAAENIFLVDPESMRLLEANAAFQRSLGYASEELEDLTLYEIVDLERGEINRNVRRIVEGEDFSGERRYRRKNGTLLDVEVSASAISYGGRVVLCIVAHDVTDRKKAEEGLRRSLGSVLALYEAGQILISALDLEERGARLLEIVRRVSGLEAAVVSLRDEDGPVRPWKTTGAELLWSASQKTPEATSARRAVEEGGVGPRAYYLGEPAGDSPRGEMARAGVCLPLRARGRVIGLLETFGGEELADKETLGILESLADQAGVALENARLYEELTEREKRLEELVGKLMVAQEEERRRIAYEVHDGLTQIAVATHNLLQAFADDHPPGTPVEEGELGTILALAQQTVVEARRVIADLRPTILDDFGLDAAVRQQVATLRAEPRRVEYSEALGGERLPPEIETALFRVAQEALANARKHAGRAPVFVTLSREGGKARLEVADRGRGFDPSAVRAGSGPGERVGLSSMRERVALLGGDLEVRSRPGEGTAVIAEVPLPRAEGSEAPDGV